jgi:hypothetical protein
MRRVGQALQRSRLAESLRQFGERAPFSELAKQLGGHQPPADFRRWLGRSVEPAKPGKATAWRVKVPHAAEAIDQMLSERERDPSLRLVKAQIDRVKVILRKKYRHHVADSQSRTIRRMIKEQAALKRQS